MGSWMKDLLGRVPAAAAAYSAVRPQRPRTRYSLEQLVAHLPAAAQAVRASAAESAGGKRLILFATLHYWIEQAVMVGLVLRGMGYHVSVAYLPFSDWRKPGNLFDVQRQDQYTRRVLAPVGDLIKVIPLLDRGDGAKLPRDLAAAAAQASAYDVMYSMQAENPDMESALAQLRMERNCQAGAAALSLMGRERPDVAVIPNGLVTELGMFFQTARFLGVPTVTYEFNDQREQIWIAHDDVVMRQNTDALWAARGSVELSSAELGRIRELEAARSSAKTYGKGTRQWQDLPGRGAAALRSELGLDERPVVLLATNVLGDSLTLGRHLFASSMAEWI